MSMRWVLWVVAMVAALSHVTPVVAQGLPPGGYYADGAYYVPADPPASAVVPAVPNWGSACPTGYGIPTMYVASTPTMVRIYHVWPVGGDAPGFPYVPVYPSQLEC
jgi:hypothetical protein